MNKNCVVNQRELHADTKSFSDALRAALREDPDVVLIGEMARSWKPSSQPFVSRKTGPLTFGTLHTNSRSPPSPASLTSSRRISNPDSAQLSLVLEGILCQSLLPKADNKGRAMCMEVLVPNSAVRNLIREDKIHQIYSSMQSGRKIWHANFNQSLATLYFQKQITLEVAMARSSNQDELQEMINRGASLLTRGARQRPWQEGRRQANDELPAKPGFGQRRMREATGKNQ